MSARKRSRFSVDPLLDELVDYLFNARRKLIYVDGGVDFDYPDYGGLPKKISNRLSSDVVDRIQSNLEEIAQSRTKKSFEAELVPLIVEDFIR